MNVEFEEFRNFWRRSGRGSEFRVKVGVLIGERGIGGHGAGRLMKEEARHIGHLVHMHPLEGMVSGVFEFQKRRLYFENLLGFGPDAFEFSTWGGVEADETDTNGVTRKERAEK